jgi:hypothetical protein
MISAVGKGKVSQSIGITENHTMTQTNKLQQRQQLTQASQIVAWQATT